MAVEQELTSAATRLGLPADYSSQGRLIEALRKSGDLGYETYEILRRMRNLRNMAVHGRAVPGISPDEAREFLAFAAAVIQRLQEIGRLK